MTGAWQAARLLAEALRARYVAASTGRRWRRTPRECPPWCRRGPGCTPTDGEHRSTPLTWRRPYGGIVATRAQPATTGAGYVELRVSVRLDPDEQVAQGQAEAITAGVDMTVRAILDRPAVAAPPMARTAVGPGRRALPVVPHS